MIILLKRRVTKNFRFIDHALDFMSNDKNEVIWYYNNLEFIFENNTYTDKSKDKRWKNAFGRFVSLLPAEMKDLFIIGKSISN